MRGLTYGALFASLFWVFLFLFHSEGNRWGFSIFLSFSGMVAGMFVAAGVLALVAQKRG